MERSSVDVAGSPVPKPSLSFLSQEPKVGDPPLEWDDFKRPRLRRFPRSRNDIELQRFLGRGEDGITIKAQIKGGEAVAVKIVSRIDRVSRPVTVLDPSLKK